MKALHIISSPRGNQSYSYGLSSAIVNRLLQNNTVKSIIERNLTEDKPPYIDEVSIKEFYKIPDQINTNPVLAYADSVFSEIREADIIIIGTPMYNLGISTLLKGWIDQLIRFGITYGYGADGKREGYLKGKKVYLAIASGGKLDDFTENTDFSASYLKAVFNTYLGISDICTLRIAGTALSGFEADYEEIIKDIQ